MVYWYMQIKVQVFLLSSSRMPSLGFWLSLLSILSFITGFYLVKLGNLEIDFIYILAIHKFKEETRTKLQLKHKQAYVTVT